MRYLAFALSLGLSAAAAAQGADYLVGRPYAGLPGNWAEIRGSTLGRLPGDDREYALSEFRRLDDQAALALYHRLDRYQDDRYPISTILAALEVDDVREGETVTATECELRDGPAGARVVAVAGEPVFVEPDEVYRFGPVRLAWMLDRTAVRFVALDPARVVCPDDHPID